MLYGCLVIVTDKKVSGGVRRGPYLVYEPHPVCESHAVNYTETDQRNQDLLT